MIAIDKIREAEKNLQGIIRETPCPLNVNLSDQFGCSIYLKREDLQVVRSFKIRGAYNKMFLLSEQERAAGVICASAGNHAQGVAMACQLLQIKGTIVMPYPTPLQKVNKVRHFGKDWIEIVLEGDTFDDAYVIAKQKSQESDQVFIHPFDDLDVVAGQGTVAAEMLTQLPVDLDYLLIAVGGGGLISGVGSYFKALSPATKIIAVESAGAPALHESISAGNRIRLETIDTFADGIAVKQVGQQTFPIIQEICDRYLVVPEGKICSTILQLYTDEAIVAEPAGAVSIAALDQLREEIKGKNVGVILCGGNNDVNRTQEITERALLYEGKKHYFLIRFPQRAGALREFLDLLGPQDDITHFEYTKKTNKVSGPAMVGIELDSPSGFQPLLDRLKEARIDHEHLNDKPLLFDMLI